MIKPHAPGHSKGKQYEVTCLNRGSSQSDESSKQINLNLISSFRFTKYDVKANEKKSTSKTEMNKILLPLIYVVGHALLLGLLFHTCIMLLCGRHMCLKKERKI